MRPLKGSGEHLGSRERRPDAAAGLVIGPLAGHGEKVRSQEALRPYAEIVDRLVQEPFLIEVQTIAAV